MNIKYDPEQDILQISFNQHLVEETTQIAPGLILDYDEDGKVVGIELRKASQKIEDPSNIDYEITPIKSKKPLPKVNKDFV